MKKTYDFYLFFSFSKISTFFLDLPKCLPVMSYKAGIFHTVKCLPLPKHTHIKPLSLVSTHIK